MVDQKKPKELEEKALYEAILSLKTVEECFLFFQDLCTPGEISVMKERWQIVSYLQESQLSYRQIHEKTKASLTTIGRVARFLNQENNGGYRLVLERLKKKDKVNE